MLRHLDKRFGGLYPTVFNMMITAENLSKAHEIVREEARVARHEWEAALEASRTTQRAEAKAREKYLALAATVQLLAQHAEPNKESVGESADHT